PARASNVRGRIRASKPADESHAGRRCDTALELWPDGTSHHRDGRGSGMTPASVDGAVMTAPAAGFSLDAASGGRATLRLSGDWRVESRRPSFAELCAALDRQPGIRALDFDTAALA